MQIRTISVQASRTLPHPTEQYANFRSAVTLSAELAEGDDADVCVRELQGKAESLVEQHAAELGASIEEFQRGITSRRRVKTLEHQVAQQQAEIDRLRSEDMSLPLFKSVASQ